MLPLGQGDPTATVTVAVPTTPIDGVVPTDIPATQVEPTLNVTPSYTPLPSPTPLDGSSTDIDQPPATTPIGTSTDSSVAETPVAPDTPPLRGSFDVYLGAPTEGGTQSLQWLSTSSGVPITEIQIRTDDGTAMRAGQYIYFLAPGSRQPRRANTAGAIQDVAFAAPPLGTSYYEFLPSATGDYLAWLIVAPDRTFTIHVADETGSDVRQVAGDTLLAGEQVHLVRVTNDGLQIFYDRRPEAITHDPLFNQRYDIYMVSVVNNGVIRLPGEPGCGETLVCDAHISPDGAYFVRLLPSQFTEPVIVTNLVSSVQIARFPAAEAPPGTTLQVGYPLLTPGGELIYIEALGPPDLATYRLVWADLVSGDQRIVVDLGHERHRPLGWASDGISLLTTRDPDLYDTWQINTETGAIRQIASLMFLGHIVEPAT